MTTTPVTLTQALTDIGSIFTELSSHFTSILQLVLSQPVLLIMFGIMVTGAIIGLAFRVMSRG